MIDGNDRIDRLVEANAMALTNLIIIVETQQRTIWATLEEIRGIRAEIRRIADFLLGQRSDENQG